MYYHVLPSWLDRMSVSEQSLLFLFVLTFIVAYQREARHDGVRLWSVDDAIAAMHTIRRRRNSPRKLVVS